MFSLRRRWQSIDRKLPLITSGLVVLTALVLATTAYALLERALLDAAGRRLLGSAKAVARMVTRPGALTAETLAIDSTLRAYVRGTATREAALAALARGTSPSDTLKLRGALLDTAGNVILEYKRDSSRAAARWPVAAIARGEIGDTTSLGPIEHLGGRAAMAMVHALRDAADSGTVAPLIGYVVDTRSVSGRNAEAIRHVIGTEVQLLIGKPGTPLWTDLAVAAPAPSHAAAAALRGDSIIDFDDGVGAITPLPGTTWAVWVAQPRITVIAPARRLLWTIIPVGLLIALAGAALMWRVTRSITRPIAQLTDAAENVASDNGAPAMQPTVLMPITGNEVARLRYAFERMARRVSERQTLELQLRQSQKLEAVGRLAGGVAHDFNNLLTAIRSYSDLLLEDTPAWDPKRGDLLEIRKAADRAAALTAQLLAFSRKQMLQPRVIDTAAVLADLETMLQRLIMEDIALTVRCAPDVWHVKVDRGQLEQVIVNLTVNAKDSMPDGGAITITASNTTLEHPVHSRHGEVPAGKYVAISVADTGIGMDVVTQNRVFEPFFTTKGVGGGTGLGLATVHGIVAQSGGYVNVESEPKRGTAFTVYLPRVEEALPADRPKPAAQTAVPVANVETILLVEDEQAVRALACRILRKAGFRVLESASPSHALKLADVYRDDIRVVVSDVVMPEMSGPTLVGRLAEICPDAAVLFMSGYTDDEMLSRGLANPGASLLHKPFSAQELVERVRQALDGMPKVSNAPAIE